MKAKALCQQIKDDKYDILIKWLLGSKGTISFPDSYWYKREFDLSVEFKDRLIADGYIVTFKTITIQESVTRPFWFDKIVDKQIQEVTISSCCER